MNLLRLVPLALILAPLAVPAWLQAMDAAPAAVVRTSGKSRLDSFPNARVVDETMDGISFLPTADAKTPQKIPRGSYTVDYAEPGEIAEYRGARQAEAEERYDDALVGYQESVKANLYRWVVERALLGSARCLVKQKLGTKALAQLTEFEQRFPSSALQPQLWKIRAEAQLASGKVDEALATYAALADKAKEWGRDALLAGGRGQAQLLRERKDHTKAAEVLTRLLTAIEPEQDGGSWGLFALELAEAHQANHHWAEAMAVLNRASLAPIPPALQAEARLALARGTFDGAKDTRTVLAAYDHAAIAVAIAPGSAAAGKARQLLRDLVKRLEQATDLSPADKAEHKKVAMNL